MRSRSDYTGLATPVFIGENRLYVGMVLEYEPIYVPSDLRDMLQGCYMDPVEYHPLEGYTVGEFRLSNVRPIRILGYVTTIEKIRAFIKVVFSFL